MAFHPNVWVLLPLLVIGYVIPLVLLLRALRFRRSSAWAVSTLLLVPGVNCLVLYLMAWTMRQQRRIEAAAAR